MEQAEESAKSLNKAMKGIGTDESRLIKEIVGHSNAQRQLIKQKYLAMYGKTLDEDIKSEVKGYFLDGLLALLDPIDEYDAKCIHKFIKGVGTNEKDLIQTLCPKDAHEVESLRAAYKKLYDRDMEKDIAGEDNGDFGRILRSIASGARENAGVNHDLAKKEAQALYDAGEGTFGTNESEFIRILCSRSFAQLSATFEAYTRLSGHDIEKAIKNEMSGDLERACLAIAKSAKNKAAYFAEQMHEAMSGVGTKDEDLSRLLVSRAERDLPAIKTQYKNLYGKSLYDAIKSERWWRLK